VPKRGKAERSRNVLSPVNQGARFPGELAYFNITSWRHRFSRKRVAPTESIRLLELHRLLSQRGRTRGRTRGIFFSEAANRIAWCDRISRQLYFPRGTTTSINVDCARGRARGQAALSHNGYWRSIMAQSIPNRGEDYRLIEDAFKHVLANRQSADLRATHYWSRCICHSVTSVA